MKHVLCTVYDLKAEYYVNPFVCRNAGEATRMFLDAVNDPKSQMFDHPEDFCLFVIGTFDPQTGELLSTPQQSLGKAIDYRRSSHAGDWPQPVDG
jgi:hypothetical protein